MPIARHRLRAALLTLATLGVLAPGGLPAQTPLPPEPPSIPTPLVHALLGGSPSRIVVDTIPSSFPAELVPPGTSSLGGLSRRGMLTAFFADTSSQALANYQRLLLSRGFARPAPREESGFQSGGGQSDYYCRDSVRVSASVASSSPARRVLRVEYVPPTRQPNPCAPAPSLLPRPFGDKDVLQVPRLPAPAGAVQQGRGGSSSISGVETRAILADSTRTPAEVAAHYAEQLAAAGWTTSTPVADSMVAAVALGAIVKTDVHWYGTLLVRRNGREHEITLSMKPDNR